MPCPSTLKIVMSRKNPWHGRYQEWPISSPVSWIWGRSKSMLWCSAGNYSRVSATVTLGFKHITANNEWITERYNIIGISFHIRKRLFDGTLPANNNFIARALTYFCPKSLIENCVNKWHIWLHGNLMEAKMDMRHIFMQTRRINHVYFEKYIVLAVFYKKQ